MRAGSKVRVASVAAGIGKGKYGTRTLLETRNENQEPRTKNQDISAKLDLAAKGGVRCMSAGKVQLVSAFAIVFVSTKNQEPRTKKQEPKQVLVLGRSRG